MMPSVTGLVPLLQVFDMPASVGFYRDVLGFSVVMTSGGERYWWAMLELGGARVMLNTMYEEGKRPDRPEAGRVAGHGDVGLFIDCSDVAGVREEVRSKGWPVGEVESRPYGMRQVYLRDPDGYEVCFQEAVAG